MYLKINYQKFITFVEKLLQNGTFFALDTATIKLTMLSTDFYVIQTENGDMIRDAKSMLRINIFRLDGGLFQPNPSELQFYSRYADALLAFETVNIKDYLRPLVASALLWYAQYIGYPEMNISTEDPRPSLRAG